MTQYVVVADSWERVTKWTDTPPRQIVESEVFTKGDVVDLDPETDRADIERLAEVQFRPALVEKSVFDEQNRAQQRVNDALARARAASIAGPFVSNPHAVEADEEGNGPFPEGSRVDGAPSTVGVGGTDPEPQGFSGEAGEPAYDDADEWSYADLQAAARARGLSAGGSRADLVDRLLEFDRVNAAPLSKRAAEGTLDDDDKDVALRRGNSAQPDQA